MPPTFVWHRRQWQTSQTRPYPRGRRNASTRWKWHLRPERKTTQAHRRPKFTPDGNASQWSSALMPWKTLTSTWTNLFQLSMEYPGRGANFSVTSSTISTGFPAPTRSQTPTVKTPYPEISWGKKMGPGPPEIHSSGGTSTQSPTCYALPLSDNIRWRPH